MVSSKKENTNKLVCGNRPWNPCLHGQRLTTFAWADLTVEGGAAAGDRTRAGEHQLAWCAFILPGHRPSRRSASGLPSYVINSFGGWAVPRRRERLTSGFIGVSLSQGVSESVRYEQPG